jgi:serine protease
MATPHVSGTIALLLALAPNTNPAEMAWVIERTTTDVNLKGWDQRSGWGMVNALAAAKKLAPGAFGSQPAPPASPPRRRSVRP